MNGGAVSEEAFQRLRARFTLEGFGLTRDGDAVMVNRGALAARLLDVAAIRRFAERAGVRVDDLLAAEASGPVA